MQETWAPSLGWEDPLEKKMATHSNILAWKISWTEEPGGLQSMGSQRVRHNWTTKCTAQHEANYRYQYISTLNTVKDISLMRFHHMFIVCVCVHTQSCPTLCNTMDCSPPDSSVHGIFQARILKWVSISSSRGSFQPWTQTHVFSIASRFLTTEPLGKPQQSVSFHYFPTF